MRKITSILMLLLFVFSSGVSAQGFKVSTDAEKHWFVIKNFRSGKFAAFGSEEKGETDNTQKSDICQKSLDELTNACYWYAVADGEGYKLHNAATGKVVDGHAWTETGRTMYVKASYLLGGYYTISTETDQTSWGGELVSGCWDDQAGKTGIGFWKHIAGDCEGTSWLFVDVDDPATLVSKEKVALAVRVAESNFLVGVNPGQYPSTVAYSLALTAAQEILNSTTATKDDYDSKLTALETALAEATDAQTKTKNDLEVGSYYRIQNTYHMNYTGVALYDANYKTDSRMCNYELNQMDPCQIWKLEEAGGKKFLVNVGTGLYPQEIKGGNGSPNSDAGAKNDAYGFTWKVTDASSTSMPVFNIFFGGGQVNVDDNGNVNRWNAEKAHHYLWKVKKTDDEILELVNDWVRAKNMTANSGAQKLQVVDGVTQVIWPSEFAEPSVVNAAIDAVKAYTDAPVPTLKQAQALCNNYAIVKRYEDMANKYDGILDVEYDLKGQYGTIILPVNYKIPQNVKFYTCSTADANGVLNLKKIDSGSKNQPYIVEYTGEDMPTVDNPKKYQIIGYQKGALTTNQTVGLLTGVLEKGGHVPSGSYILSKYNGRFAFYKVDGENVKQAQQYRCYLTIPADQPTAVSAFYLNGEGETTGINALLNGNNGETEIYDLSGKRLNHLQKGINIVNGQKVLVK